MPKIEIEDCAECPAQLSKRMYTPDAFEMVFDWLCKDAKNRKIGQVETFDPHPPIPDWCPRR